jgi:hypothetical protein
MGGDLMSIGNGMEKGDARTVLIDGPFLLRHHETARR